VQQRPLASQAGVVDQDSMNRSAPSSSLSLWERAGVRGSRRRLGWTR
jgi:hypothetical protein